jgi:glyoxylase-like metal-dependent hydrolase (beta-lactamase superfamily II)
MLDRSDPELAPLFERMESEGIFMMEIPTPFAVGPVNCYLIEDDPLTIFDPGPNSGEAIEALVVGLRSRGHELADLERIVITHQHIDHLGLVEVVQHASGAEVVCLDKCKPWMENFDEESSATDRWASGMLVQHGVGEEVAVALRAVAKAFRGWGSECPVDRTFSEGDFLEFRDRKLEIFHRPGHSSTDTVFWNADTQTMIAADHLIKNISSNPLLERPAAEGEPRPQELVLYIESLKKTREMPATITLSGHGEPIVDHAALIDARFESTDKRVEKLYAMLAESGPQTAHELCRGTWGNIAVTQAFLTLSEVLGNLDILENAGRVAPEETDGVIKYSVVA